MTSPMPGTSKTPDADETVNAARLKETFKELADEDGRITSAKLRVFIDELGFELTELEIQDMLEVADTSGTGTVSYKGLVGMVREFSQEFPNVKLTKEELRRELTLLSTDDTLYLTPTPNASAGRGRESVQNVRGMPTAMNGRESVQSVVRNQSVMTGRESIQSVRGMQSNMNGRGSVKSNNRTKKMTSPMPGTSKTLDADEAVNAARLKEAFKVLADEDGRITSAKLRVFVDELGYDFTESEIQEMVEVADTSGTGTVSYKGLVGMVREFSQEFPNVKLTREELRRELTLLSKDDTLYLTPTPNASAGKDRESVQNVRRMKPAMNGTDRVQSVVRNQSVMTGRESIQSVRGMQSDMNGRGSVQSGERNQSVMTGRESIQSVRGMQSDMNGRGSVQSGERNQSVMKGRESIQSVRGMQSDMNGRGSVQSGERNQSVMNDRERMEGSTNRHGISRQSNISSSSSRLAGEPKISRMSHRSNRSRVSQEGARRPPKQSVSYEHAERNKGLRDTPDDEAYIEIANTPNIETSEIATGRITNASINRTPGVQARTPVIGLTKESQIDTLSMAPTGFDHHEQNDSNFQIAVSINGDSRRSNVRETSQINEFRNETEGDTESPDNVETYSQQNTNRNSDRDIVSRDEREEDGDDDFDHEDDSVFYDSGHISRKSYVPENDIDEDVDTVISSLGEVRIHETHQQKNKPHHKGKQTKSTTKPTKDEGKTPRRRSQSKAKPTQRRRPNPPQSKPVETKDTGYYSAIGCAYKLSQIRVRQRLLYLMWRHVYDEAVRKAEESQKRRKTRRRKIPSVP